MASAYPQRLRVLLTAMDVSVFARHVIAIPYRSLHPTHPEWYDGVTFNAHLASYLRRRRDETASRGPGQWSAHEELRIAGKGRRGNSTHVLPHPFRSMMCNCLCG